MLRRKREELLLGRVDIATRRGFGMSLRCTISRAALAYTNAVHEARILGASKKRRQHARVALADELAVYPGDRPDMKLQPLLAGCR